MQNTSVVKGLLAWLIYIFLMLESRVFSCNKNARTEGFQHYVSISLNFSHSTNSVGVVFSNRALLSVIWEQPIILATTLVIRRIYGTPLANISIIYNPILVAKYFLGYKRCLVGALSVT